MSKASSLSYVEIVRALQRDGWIVVRQRGSHIRLQKRIGDELLKITVLPTNQLNAPPYLTSSTKPELMWSNFEV